MNLNLLMNQEFLQRRFFIREELRANIAKIYNEDYYMLLEIYGKESLSESEREFYNSYLMR